MERLYTGQRHKEDLYANVDIAGEGEEEEKGGHGSTVEKERVGGLNIKYKVALAAGLKGTGLLDQFNYVLLVEDDFFNLYQQESNILESLGLAPQQQGHKKAGLSSALQDKSGLSGTLHNEAGLSSAPR